MATDAPHQKIPLSAELTRRLAEAALESGRSLIEEVAFRLEQSFRPHVDVSGLEGTELLMLKEMLVAFRQSDRGYTIMIGADPATGRGGAMHGFIPRDPNEPRPSATIHEFKPKKPEGPGEPER